MAATSSEGGARAVLASDCELQCQLCCGDWEVELADVGEVDCLCSDPPYSERTHSGHDEGTGAANRASSADELKYDPKPRRQNAGNPRRSITYVPWTPADVERFVAHWAPRTRGWFVAMTDHVLAPVYERALEAHGRYVFSPLSFVHPGRSVRLGGDGPAQWSVSIIVARPKTRAFARWGALPGGYVLPREHNERSPIVGGKPLWLMRALARDYSRPGDLIVDPCAGGGTTLIAARAEGRRSIGAERDVKTFELARKRLAKPYTPLLFGDELRARAAARVANDNGQGVEQAALCWADSDSGDVDP